jgi:hypothetical protein
MRSPAIPGRRRRGEMADYYTKMDAMVQIAHELADRGWKLYGYKEDCSDSMTDYFDPARWKGIATKNEYILCINISPYDVMATSGRDIVEYRPTNGPTCEHCAGSGVWPNGLTYREAQQDPEKQHANEWAKARGMVSIFPRTVSPLHYHDDGKPKCLYCSGTGNLPGKPECVVIDRYPVFRANPKGSSWHVEKDKEIIARGSGVYTCANDPEKVTAFCDRIEAIVNGEAAAPARVINSAVSVTIRHNEERNGIEIEFTEKPSVDILNALRSSGFRWHRQNRYWYAKRTKQVMALVDELQRPSAQAE